MSIRGPYAESQYLAYASVSSLFWAKISFVRLNAQVTFLLEEFDIRVPQSMLYAYMALMDIPERIQTLVSQHLSSEAYRKVRLEVRADGTPDKTS